MLGFEPLIVTDETSLLLVCIYTPMLFSYIYPDKITCSALFFIPSGTYEKKAVMDSYLLSDT